MIIYTLSYFTPSGLLKFKDFKSLKAAIKHAERLKRKKYFIVDYIKKIVVNGIAYIIEDEEI